MLIVQICIIILRFQKKRLFLHCSRLNTKPNINESGIWLLCYQKPTMIKRIFDISLSIFGLVIFFPLFLIIAILIKADSKGSVFYKQIRVGRFNKDFKIIKFRTMKCDTEDNFPLSKQLYKSQITKTGIYLRKYKLDELPQLINVLKGDMSFVGPRPVLRKFVDLYTDEQLKVLDIRPGITDMASIKYKNEFKILNSVENPETYYLEVIMPDKLSLNLKYIKEQSLWLDIKLILKTIF